MLRLGRTLRQASAAQVVRREHALRQCVHHLAKLRHGGADPFRGATAQDAVPFVEFLRVLRRRPDAATIVATSRTNAASGEPGANAIGGSERPCTALWRAAAFSTWGVDVDADDMVRLRANFESSGPVRALLRDSARWADGEVVDGDALRRRLFGSDLTHGEFSELLSRLDTYIFREAATDAPSSAAASSSDDKTKASSSTNSNSSSNRSGDGGRATGETSEVRWRLSARRDEVADTDPYVRLARRALLAGPDDGLTIDRLEPAMRELLPAGAELPRLPFGATCAYDVVDGKLLGPWCATFAASSPAAASSSSTANAGNETTERLRVAFVDWDAALRAAALELRPEGLTGPAFRRVLQRVQPVVDGSREIAWPALERRLRDSPAGRRLFRVSRARSDGATSIVRPATGLQGAPRTLDDEVEAALAIAGCSDAAARDGAWVPLDTIMPMLRRQAPAVYGGPATDTWLDVLSRTHAVDARVRLLVRESAGAERVLALIDGSAISREAAMDLLAAHGAAHATRIVVRKAHDAPHKVSSTPLAAGTAGSSGGGVSGGDYVASSWMPNMTMLQAQVAQAVAAAPVGTAPTHIVVVASAAEDEAAARAELAGLLGGGIRVTWLVAGAAAAPPA